MFDPKFVLRLPQSFNPQTLIVVFTPFKQFDLGGFHLIICNIQWRITRT